MGDIDKTVDIIGKFKLQHLDEGKIDYLNISITIFTCVRIRSGLIECLSSSTTVNQTDLNSN